MWVVFELEAEFGGETSRLCRGRRELYGLRLEAEGILLEADDDGWAASLNDARWCNCVLQRSCGGRSESESESEY